jgi:hypothetical protein
MSLQGERKTVNQAACQIYIYSFVSDGAAIALVFLDNM